MTTPYPAHHQPGGGARARQERPDGLSGATLSHHAQPREAADIELLAAAAADGGRAALDALLAALTGSGLLHAAVGRVLFDHHLVEDVCQEVLIRVGGRISSWDRRSRFTTWVWAVAHNLAVDTLRSLPAAAPLPEENLTASDQRRMSSLIAERQTILDLLAGLPDPFRQAVILRDIDQLPYPEIARHLGVGEATVRSRVRRGRQLAADRLAEGSAA